MCIIQIGNRIARLALGLASIQEQIRGYRKQNQKIYRRIEQINRGVETINRDSEQIVQLCRVSHEEASRHADILRTAATKSDSTIRAVDTLRKEADDLKQRMETFLDKLANVSEASSSIETFARQTGMLAFNTAIEAERLGAEGRGVAVIAKEVKTLSRRATKSNDGIGKAVAHLTSEFQRLSRDYQEHAKIVESTQAHVNELCSSSAQGMSCLTGLAQESEHILVASEANLTRCQEISRYSESIKEKVGMLGDRFDHTNHLVEDITEASMSIMTSTTELGINTDDTIFTTMAQETADVCRKVLSERLSDGYLSKSIISKDRTYVPIEGTNPEQFIVEGYEELEYLLRDHLDQVLDRDDRIIFCCLTDPKGHVPVHNSKVSRSPTGNIEHDSRFCRNLRIFEDAGSQRAAKNTQPLQLHAYRRDLGGGEFIVMRECNVPITIEGDICYNLRLGYRMVDDSNN